MSPSAAKAGSIVSIDVRPEGRTLQETNQGLKPSSRRSGTARLKPCPDTKQEFFRSLLKAPRETFT
jgi:hypothetical protein